MVVLSKSLGGFGSAVPLADRFGAGGSLSQMLPTWLRALVSILFRGLVSEFCPMMEGHTYCHAVGSQAPTYKTAGSNLDCKSGLYVGGAEQALVLFVHPRPNSCLKPYRFAPPFAICWHDRPRRALVRVATRCVAPRRWCEFVPLLPPLSSPVPFAVSASMAIQSACSHPNVAS